jgi:signal transduction histidine kinase
MQQKPLPTLEGPAAILVIDDELGPRESLRFLLKNEYRVMCADSVAQGLGLLRASPPDAVIMDIRMPGQNGIEGLREIRKIDPDLSVIMLTGYAAIGTAQKAIRHEANDYIEKPFDAPDMRRAVQHHVAQTRLRRKRGKLLREADALERRINETREKDRLAELGQFSAELIHDLRNALNMVNGSTELLRMGMQDLQQADAYPEAERYLDIQEKAMQQCVDLLDTWQRLIKQSPQQQTRFSIHEFVHACVEACQPMARKASAHLACGVHGGGGELLGDRVQLARALTNLIHNAIHALPPANGLVHVSAECLETTVRLTVSDNGCGISPENLERIFTPHYTTKSACGGMGLGLFIARKITQAYGGTLTVESAFGQGTSFSILLPKCDPVIEVVAC